METLPELMASVLIPTFLFLVLPWMIFHYVTQWKKAGTLTKEDEILLDELHDLARRCDERLCTVERIMTAENPNWRAVACDPADIGIEDKKETLRRIK
jgi:phage shock protein B